MRAKKVLGIVLSCGMLLSLINPKIAYANTGEKSYSVDEYVQMLIEENKIQDKNYFYCGTVPVHTVNSDAVNYSISIQSDAVSEEGKNDNAIILLSKVDDEVTQDIIMPYDVSEDGSLVSLLSSTPVGDAGTVVATSNGDIFIHGVATYTIYHCNMENEFRGPYYIPRVATVAYLKSEPGYSVRTIHASLSCRGLYEDMLTGVTYGYHEANSNVSQYMPTMGTRYSGNFISFPTNYAFSTSFNGISTCGKFIVDLTYTYNSKTYYATNFIDLFSGETIWDLEDPVTTD